MNEIRLTDSFGLPTRRQLYSQHRALSRALMDSELQCLRRKGQITLTRLQSLAKSISSNTDKSKTEYLNCHVVQRLNEVTAIFGEVDRAARRLEELTEQRRERLREITRQKALEEEIKEVKKPPRFYLCVIHLLCRRLLLFALPPSLSLSFSLCTSKIMQNL